MFRNETQASISEWCEATFGPVSSNARVAARANEELAELLEKLAEDERHPRAPEEVADVVIVLARLATRLGLEIADVGRLEHPQLARPIEAFANANQRMSALLRALTVNDGPSGQSREKLACLLGSLWGLAEVMACDLGKEVDRKMQINKAREWKLDGSGHGYHIRSEKR